MRLIDADKIADVKMYDGRELSQDFFDADALELDNVTGAYIVDSVDACIDQAESWGAVDGREVETEAIPRLRAIREHAGLTQTKLSQLSGIHIMTISKLERGVSKMGNTTLTNGAALARALGVRMEDLL